MNRATPRVECVCVGVVRARVADGRLAPIVTTRKVGRSSTRHSAGGDMPSTGNASEGGTQHSTASMWPQKAETKAEAATPSQCAWCSDSKIETVLSSASGPSVWLASTTSMNNGKPSSPVGSPSRVRSFTSCITVVAAASCITTCRPASSSAFGSSRYCVGSSCDDWLRSITQRSIGNCSKQRRSASERRRCRAGSGIRAVSRSPRGRQEQCMHMQKARTLPAPSDAAYHRSNKPKSAGGHVHDHINAMYVFGG